MQMFLAAAVVTTAAGMVGVVLAAAAAVRVGMVMAVAVAAEAMGEMGAPGRAACGQH